MNQEKLLAQPNQVRCAGLRDNDSGSEVKVYHPDGTITWQPATYWYDIQRDRRRQLKLGANR